MKIYIDNEFKCHADNPDGTYRDVEARFFDGKCPEFIEGYRYIPDGESWTDDRGVTFSGLMLSPWRDYGELDAAQRTYDKQQMADMRAALKELGVSVNG